MRIVRKNSLSYSNPWNLGVIGKIKTGIKAISQNGKEYPKSTDYFVFTSDVKRRIEKLNLMFGEKPTSLPVTFHTNDLNQVCIERFELRDSSGKLAAYGDGETFFLSKPAGWMPSDKNAVRTLQNSLKAQNFNPRWDQVLILRVLILGFDELGTWEYRTKAKETSIPQIRDQFDYILNSFSRVAGVPFTLNVKKHTSNRSGVNRNYPVVSLVCDFSPEMLEMVGKYGDEIKGMLTAEKVNNFKPALLSSPDIDESDFDEAEIINELL